MVTNYSRCSPPDRLHVVYGMESKRALVLMAEGSAYVRFEQVTLGSNLAGHKIQGALRSSCVVLGSMHFAYSRSSNLPILPEHKTLQALTLWYTQPTQCVGNFRMFGGRGTQGKVGVSPSPVSVFFLTPLMLPKIGEDIFENAIQ